VWDEAVVREHDLERRVSDEPVIRRIEAIKRRMNKSGRLAFCPISHDGPAENGIRLGK
jgi:hypothetical protein